MKCIMWWAFVTLVVAVSAGTAPTGYQARDRPRSIRGFKNAALSTARGFGKRTTLEAVPESVNEPLPADWFAEELSQNPDLARLVVRKFIDSNQDGLLTTNELIRPLFYQTDPQSPYN